MFLQLSQTACLIRTGPFYDVPDDGGGGGGTDKTANADENDETKNAGDAQKTEEGGKPEEKSGEDGKKEDGEGEPQPLTAETIKLPEGAEYDKELGDAYLEIANKHGLTSEAAQDFANLYFKIAGDYALKMDESVKAAQAAEAEAFKARQADEEKQWLEACKADKVTGGHNWEASRAKAVAGIKALGGEKTLEFFEKTMGIIYHPDVFPFLVRVGEAAGEDKMGGGGSKAAKLDYAAAIFGNSTKGR
jgi:hypothetical protein